MFLPLWFSGCFWNDFWTGFWNHGLGTAGSAKWLFLSIFLRSATVSLLSQSRLASCLSLSSLPHPQPFSPLLCCVTTINIVLTGQQSDSLLSSKHELNNNPFNIGQRHYCLDGGSVKKKHFLTRFQSHLDPQLYLHVCWITIGLLLSLAC